MRIGVGSLEIGRLEKRSIAAILEGGRISPGPWVRKFETDFAHYHGARHGLFVSSGTDALRIALSALKEIHGWKDGDGIIVPAITFVATANVVLQCNLKPFFVDVSMYDCNINPENIERRLSEAHIKDRIRAIIPVHMFGKPCAMPEILKIARKNRFKVIEDSCETMGVGPVRGDVACYSTYVAHLIATGVGGLAITNNPKYDEIMRSYANHGRNPAYLPGHTPCRDITKRFQFDRIGYSSRLTEMEAALGLAQLARLEAAIKRRRAIADRFNESLCRFWDDLMLPHCLDGTPHAFMMYPIVIKEGSKVKKWDLCRYLEAHGIETRELLPLINQPCYKALKIPQNQFYVADWINKNGFYIGCHPGLSEKDVDYVIRVFAKFFRAA